MVHLRGWAEKVGKQSVIPKDNIQLSIANRQYVTQDNKAINISEKTLEKINDPYMRISLMLQQAFGLRREESIKFQPPYAQSRYETITGWKSPKAGGVASKELSPAQQIKDIFARQMISRELGHERTEVVKVYLDKR